MSSIPVSVVIPTKNAGPVFDEVLDGLRAQQGIALQLVVVDSGSSDDTVARARTFGAVVHEIPPAEFNHGATRDLGIGLADAGVVVLMTQDAVPGDALLLQRMAQAFDDPAVGGCYVRQVARPEHDVLIHRNLDWSLTGRRVSEVRQLAHPGALDGMSPVERYTMCNFDNVCSALRKSAWETLHFGRVDFAEDIEWSKKALIAGWKIAYVAESHVVHSHDRPLSYSYRRSYVTHRKLFAEYGMMTIPSPQVAVKSTLRSVMSDSLYVLRHQPGLGRKLSLLLQIPLLNATSILGQYLGARDERKGRGRQFAGI